MQSNIKKQINKIIFDYVSDSPEIMYKLLLHYIKYSPEEAFDKYLKANLEEIVMDCKNDNEPVSMLIAMLESEIDSPHII